MNSRYFDRESVRETLRWVAERVGSRGTVLVGVDGGAGAGKTTFTSWFADRLRDLSSLPVGIVLTDRIYRPVAERWQGPLEEMPIGYDLDWERIRDEIITPLGAGRTARFRLYDWVEDRLGDPVEIEPGGTTIIDGVCALRRELAPLYDLRIWLACPLEVRVARLLGRGDTSRQELDHWLSIEDRYHRAHAPERFAHLILDSAASFSPGMGEDRLRVRKWSPPDADRPPPARS
jgi:uridine kinase